MVPLFTLRRRHLADRLEEPPVFSSLPIRKVLILGFWFPGDFIHSRRSYYLFFN